MIIFSDLDGTLLDHENYSFEAARPALEAVARSGWPLVFCTSKTRAETEAWREKTGNVHPFIVENGAAVFIPVGYFRVTFDFDREDGQYAIIELGTRYAALRRFLVEARTRIDPAIRGFGDMTVDEIAGLCGFSRAEAEMAARREYDEPFVMAGGEEALGNLEREALLSGLKVIRGGRFYHLIGGSDKGKAVRLLRRLFETERGRVEAVALGDSRNDIDMLAAVDRAVLVQKWNGTYEDNINIPGVIYAPGAGPEGWNRAVMALLDKRQPDR